MKRRFGLILIASLFLSACNEQNDSRSAYQAAGHSFSVIGALRPKADPEVMRKIQQEELAAERARQAEIERQNAAAQSAGDNPMDRDLPGVGMSPLAGTSGNSGGQSASSGSQGQGSNSWAPPANNSTANYAMSYNAPSAGFVPPPPAVTLSTAAQALPFGAPPQPDPYSNPYAYNPYMNPYAQPQQSVPSPPPISSQRSSGSLFGSGARAEADSEDGDSRHASSKKSVTVITPTGMELRSPYKQRDDLRLLWKGVIASALGQYGGGAKEDLLKVDVNLPGEASKGSLSLSQRQTDHLFNNSPLDKKLVSPTKKAQSELTQAYYRYLYAYNKFFLGQQYIAARKQEMELADSQSEKQRAAADMAQAQNDAEASKEDMRSAQNDLASIAGVQPARTVIGRVCGVAPSMDSFAGADTADNQVDQAGKAVGGFLSSVGSAFGLGKPKAKEVQASAPQIAKAKDGKDKKGKTDPPAAREPEDNASAASAEPPATISILPSSSMRKKAVSFELKDVKTTPRKSILKVAIRNNGEDNFSFDVDHVSVVEGNSKLAEAAVSAEFDSTVLEPNQEIMGTITIFGRPWNDKLTVSLSEGGKAIVMHR